jgi:hypothetical protein
MKYYRLDITTNNKAGTYNKITNLLGLQPDKFVPNKISTDPYSIWTYSVNEDEAKEGAPFNFLDILEPKFDELEKLGVAKSDITFWYLYEYEKQCSMEFHPAEMKRLGNCGIVLCVDCWETKK